MKKNISYVYLLQVEQYDFLEYKIGVSKNPESRVKTLQTGNSKSVKILFSFLSDWAYKIESRLHLDYDEYRTHGEWFELSNECLDEFLYKCELYHKNFESLSNTTLY